MSNPQTLNRKYLMQSKDVEKYIKSGTISFDAAEIIFF